MSIKRWLRGGGPIITPGPNRTSPRRPGAVIPASQHHTSAGAYAPGKMAWGPAARPIQRPPLTSYGRPITGIPLQPGQVSGTIPASGTITLSIGPAGFGNVWYPAQVTVSTTTGPLDISICSIYLGPANTPVTLLGQIFTGNGVLAAALPNMTAGQYLIAIWTGGHNGDTAAINITGTMDTISL